MSDPQYVWAVKDVPYSGCDASDCDCSTVAVLYATRQTAEQHADRHGGYVSRMRIETKLREW